MPVKTVRPTRLSSSPRDTAESQRTRDPIIPVTVHGPVPGKTRRFLDMGPTEALRTVPASAGGSTPKHSKFAQNLIAACFA